MQKKKLDKKTKPSKATSKPGKAAPKKPLKKAAVSVARKAPMKVPKKVAPPIKAPPKDKVKKPLVEVKKAVLKKPELPAKKVDRIVAAKPTKIAAPAVNPKIAAPVVGKPSVAKKEEIKKEAVQVKPKEVVPAAPKVTAPIIENKKPKKVSTSASEITAAELEALTKAIMEEEDADEIVLTDAEGRKYCKIKECDQLATVDKYCRFHYLLNWKKIQLRKKILQDGKLEKYIEDLTSRYPDKYIEMIRRDLKTEKDFMSAIQELEIDDSGIEGEFEEENEQLLEEVRGIGSGRAGAGTGREDEEF